MRKQAVCVVLMLFGGLTALAQTVRETSFRMDNGDRVLQQSAVVRADSKTVWQLISTAEGLRRFAAPRLEFELRPGGLWLASFSKDAKLDESGIHNRVLSYVPNRMLSTQIGFPKTFMEDVRNSNSVFDVLMLEPIDAKQTRVVESMSGFGAGPHWDMTYSMFRECNRQTLEALVLTVATGKSIDWNGQNPYSGHHHPEGLETTNTAPR